MLGRMCQTRLLQPLRSLEMKKRTLRDQAIELEREADSFISAMFALCEHHLSTRTQKHLPPRPECRALAASALAVQEAVKTFLAIERSLR
mgnify:CR=1 FL=1